jgi:hypothetical protein
LKAFSDWLLNAWQMFAQVPWCTSMHESFVLLSGKAFGVQDCMRPTAAVLCKAQLLLLAVLWGPFDSACSPMLSLTDCACGLYVFELCFPCLAMHLCASAWQMPLCSTSFRLTCMLYMTPVPSAGMLCNSFMLL